MSDREFGGSDDLSLPKATVQKILTEILPPDSGLTASKDFRDALIEACVEFITLISSEANEISEKDSKKTISAEHVAAALKELGFEAYVEPVLESAEEFKKSQAGREKKQNKIDASGRSTEELMAEQAKLFRDAHEKYKQPSTDVQ